MKVFIAIFNELKICYCYICKIFVLFFHKDNKILELLYILHFNLFLKRLLISIFNLNNRLVVSSS